MIGALLGLGLWVGPPVDEVRSPDRPLEGALSIEPGATCLESAVLVGVIESTLQTETVAADVEVELVGDPEDAFSLEYTVRRRGEVIAVRRFDADATTCEQLHAVVGVSVALAIDATASLPPATDEVSMPVPSLEPAPPSDPETPPELEAAEPRAEALEASPWSGAALARGGVGLHAPPRWAGVGAAAVELRWRDRVDVDLGILGAQGGFVAVGEGRAAFTLVGMTLEMCGGSTFGRVHPRGCVGMVGGGALARGRGFTTERSDRLPWVGVTFGTDVRVRVSRRVELEFGVDGLVHVLQPGFDFVDESGARRAGRAFPWIGGWLTAGVVVGFGR